MRHLYVVVDGSRTMEDQDLKPNRLTCTLKLLEYFVEEYFDQNPISQIGIIITKGKRAEKLTELSGNPRKHIAALKKTVDMTCLGEPSLYNALNLATQTLKHMPGHTSREVLVIFSSLTTCDPSNIYDLIKCLKAVKIRVSIIGLSAEVRVCTVLARETGGTYHVILDESHYRELLMHHVSPPPANSSSESSLIRMDLIAAQFTSWPGPNSGKKSGEHKRDGLIPNNDSVTSKLALNSKPGFPQHTIASLADQDAKPSFSMAHLENINDPGLTLGGYFCPQCRAKYCELPVECKVCGLTLVSAPHLARSYHHLFPLDAFQEIPLDQYIGERYVKRHLMAAFLWTIAMCFQEWSQTIVKDAKEKSEINIVPVAILTAFLRRPFCLRDESGCEQVHAPKGNAKISFPINVIFWLLNIKLTVLSVCSIFNTSLSLQERQEADTYMLREEDTCTTVKLLHLLACYHSSASLFLLAFAEENWTKRVYICKVCQSVFCVECDLFAHDILHCCPGCIHKHPAPPCV
ncbi:General transcription factor IIH subunit 2 [Varanus komodoensis]|nr:General transcription factor IIH subunit 2 [Varanus komodoensis]